MRQCEFHLSLGLVVYGINANKNLRIANGGGDRSQVLQPMLRDSGAGNVALAACLTPPFDINSNPVNPGGIGSLSDIRVA